MKNYQAAIVLIMVMLLVWGKPDLLDAVIEYVTCSDCDFNFKLY